MSSAILPHDIEAEQSVLGAMLLGGAEAADTAVTILAPVDFYREAHGAIFEAMAAVVARGGGLDVVTLQAELKRRSKLSECGGQAYLLQLSEFVPTIANLEHYAKQVAAAAIRRRLILAGHEIAQIGRDEETTATDAASRAESLVMQATKAEAGTQSLEAMRTVVPRVLEYLDERGNTGGGFVGIPAGIQSWDTILSGLRRGHMVTVAGRPAMGKTGFACCVAYNVAAARIPTLFFSLEMGKDELVQRMISSVTGIDNYQIQEGRLTTEQWAHMTRQTDTLMYAPLSIDDDPSLTVPQMLSRARRFRAEMGGIGLVVVDYLQRVRPDTTRKGGTQAEEVGEVAKGLKTMARVLDVPVIALSQLSRAVERREDKRPVLSDLGESGQIERESDSVSFLYRPSYYANAGQVLDDTEDAEVIVAKNRFGPTGIAAVTFHRKIVAFETREESSNPW